MGLEVATFISGLTPTWPTATDPKAQGDDHLRLLKSVLQATFPGADRAFRFPRALTKTANYTVLSSDDGVLFLVDTTAGNVTLTLPAIPATFFNIGVMKISADANTVTISGTVNGGSLTPLSTRWQNVQINGNGSAYYAPRAIPADLIQSADIAAQAVTLAKLVNATAQGKLIGRKTAAAGAWEEATLAEMFNTIASTARGDLWIRGAANWDRVALGAAGKVLRSDGTDAAWGYAKNPWLHVREVNNTISMAGNGIWYPRIPNTVVTNEVTGASLASNIVTLPAGTFRFQGTAPFRSQVGTHQLRLRNHSDSSTLIAGPSATVDVSGTGGNQLKMFGQFTLAAQKDVRMEHWVTGTVASQAFRESAGSGEAEVGAELLFEQVA